MMVGQKRLLNKIHQFTISSFPNSLILCGDTGSGKTLLVKEISNTLNLQVLDISQKLTQEALEEIYLRVEPYIYVIKQDYLSEKCQNSLLKFLEEPLKNAFVILLVENINILLSTIVNRCQIWELDKYTREELSQFLEESSDDDILNIAKTPGQMLNMQSSNNDFNALKNLVETMLSKLHLASFSNTLTIADKLNFDGKDTDKFDIDVFINVFQYILLKNIIENDSPYLIKLYYQTNKLQNNLLIPKINKKLLFENFLTNIKEITC